METHSLLKRRDDAMLGAHIVAVQHELSVLAALDADWL